MTGSQEGPGVRIRPEVPSDREAVRRVAVAAFADEGPTIAALLDALDAAGRVVVGLVAELDGSVVGHVQLNRSWLDARERLVDVLVLSPLSVGPGHQGRGIGGAPWSPRPSPPRVGPGHRRSSWRARRRTTRPVASGGPTSSASSGRRRGSRRRRSRWPCCRRTRSG